MSVVTAALVSLAVLAVLGALLFVSAPLERYSGRAAGRARSGAGIVPIEQAFRPVARTGPVAEARAEAA